MSEERQQIDPQAIEPADSEHEAGTAVEAEGSGSLEVSSETGATVGEAAPASAADSLAVAEAPAEVAEETPPPPPPPTVGQILRGARETRGLTVADIAHGLNLAPRQVEALEQDQWDKLPGETFARGFVRNYARFVKLDPTPLLDRMYAEAHPVAPAPTIELPKTLAAEIPQPGQAKKRDNFTILGAVGLVVVAFLIYFLLPDDAFRSAPKKLEEPAPSVTAPAPAPVETPAPGTLAAPNPVPVDNGATPVAPGAVPATPVAPAAPVTPTAPAPTPVVAPAAPVAAPVAAPAKAATVVAPASAVASNVANNTASKPAGAAVPAPAAAPATANNAKAAASAPAAATAPAAAKPSATPASAADKNAAAGSMRLHFAFTQDSWVDVTDKTGQKLITSRNVAGSEREVSGVPPFIVVVGNATHVKLTANGKPVDLNPRSKDDVARLTVQ